MGGTLGVPLRKSAGLRGEWHSQWASWAQWPSVQRSLTQTAERSSLRLDRPDGSA